jgi:signal transduction histidine kinase/CheY-like chemotaxis protein
MSASESSLFSRSRPTPLAAGAGDHLVQFYEDHLVLVASVTGYADAGLKAGEAVICICTPAHAEGLLRELAQLGHDVDALRREDRLILADAEGSLRQFMVEGKPDEHRFNRLLDSLRARAGAGRKLRAYGEMVNVLWGRGNRLAALELESFWNTALEKHRFPLLCAYLMNGFRNASDAADFQAVCGAHSHVHPVRSHAPSEQDDHLRVIAQLEQRALALEAEVAERKRLELELQSAAQQKDEFMAMLGHELRNPLAALGAALAVRDRTEPAAEGAHLRAACNRQVENLSRLVDDLLDVSRITLGKVGLVRVPVDLSAIAHHAVQTSRPLLDHRQHVCMLEVGPGALVVDGDATRLEQVISNLLHNAAKYTDEGGHITVGLAREDSAAGPCAVLRVRDNGKGIAAPMLDKIFEPFTQLEPTVERGQGGLGIGLTLVRRLVLLHGGEVSAHSAGPGQGSEFRVRLPLIEMPVPTRSAPRAPAVEPTRNKVLVVDDNADIRESLRELLVDLEQDVEVASNGHQGVAQFALQRPHVALIDVGLPGIDGYEVARQIRAAHGPAPYLVALTGYGGEDARVRAREAGFDQHVLKPIRLSVLTEILDRCAAK